MLDTSARNLMDLAHESEEFRDEFLGSWESDIDRYHGPGYRNRGNILSGVSDPENHGFEWVSHYLPLLVGGNPRVRVTTSRFGISEEIARAQQWALNRWIEQTDMRSVNEQLAVDFGHTWAVGIVSNRPRLGLGEWEDPPNWPVVKRLSPRRFGFDKAALDTKEWRYMFHVEKVDRKDLLHHARENPDEGWNIESLERSNVRNDLRYENRKQYRDRDELLYYVFWVPEVQLDGYEEEKGYHGTLFYVADGAQGYLREPRGFFGHRSGPYAFAGGYVVPDESVPLSSLKATAHQAKELNDHARASSISAADYKKLVFVTNADPDLQQKIREGRHDYVYPVNIDQLSSNFAQIEVGGITQQQITYLQIAKDRLDRNSGISEVQRGNIEGIGTATEVSAAVAASTSRAGFLVGKFYELDVSILTKVSYYLYMEDSVEIDLPTEASGILDPVTGNSIKAPRYEGGLKRGQKASDFDALDHRIEMYSMAQTSEDRLRLQLQDLDMAVTQYGPMMVQYPHVLWEDVMKERDQITGLRTSKLFDYEAARAIGAQLMQSGQAPEPPRAPVQSQYRVGRDRVVAPPGRSRQPAKKIPELKES